MFASSKASRSVVVALAMLAWLAASNHCAIAGRLAAQQLANASEDGMPSDCPMHAKHKPSESQKKNDCGGLMCCNNLPATSSVPAKLVANPLWTGALISFFLPAILDTSTPPSNVSYFLDTGPPGRGSFVELVLQRSLLAHAPPVSLS